MNLRRDLGSLANREFDVVVVGAGISGAAIAHDAALRGLRVALIDKGDFGSATSAASSKVLHGGIRHLQRLDFKQVRESAFERSVFQRIAPHLSHYVPFLIPTYRGLVKGKLALQTAVWFHHVVTASQDAIVRDPAKRLPATHRHSRNETLTLAPVLGNQADLTGSVVIPEAHMHSSERMTLAFVKSAAANGTAVANYVEAEGLVADGGVVRGLRARDLMSGSPIEIRASVVVNASGPWALALNAKFGLHGNEALPRGFSKGAHIVTRPLTSEVALVLPTAKPQVHVVDRGGRHLFVIPWRSRSLIGTSNAPFGDSLDRVRATPADVEAFVSDVNGAIPGLNLSTADVEFAFAGLYPLSGAPIGPDTYEPTAAYRIVDHRTEGIDGLVSALGAKYTTGRSLAERTVDLVAQKLGRPSRECRTTTTPLVGGEIEDLQAYVREMTRKHSIRIGEETVRHLVDHYGTQVEAVLSTGVEGLQPDRRLSPDRECIEAEVAYAVLNEMAVNLDDVILRRTGLGTIGHPGHACLVRCADIIGAILGWSSYQAAAQVERTETLLATFQRHSSASA